MKKKLLVLCAVAMLGLSACGKSALETTTAATTVATTEEVTVATTEEETVTTTEEVTTESTEEASTTKPINSDKTLEELISQEQMDMAAKQLVDSNSGSYKDVKITIKDNDITYYCTFADSIQITDAVKSQLQGMDWSSTINQAKDTFRSGYNIEPGVVSFVFYDSTGEEVLNISE